MRDTPVIGSGARAGRINQVEAYSIVPPRVCIFDRPTLLDKTCSAIYFHRVPVNS